VTGALAVLAVRPRGEPAPATVMIGASGASGAEPATA
jgi:hypothetical protein